MNSLFKIKIKYDDRLILDLKDSDPKKVRKELSLFMRKFR